MKILRISDKDKGSYASLKFLLGLTGPSWSFDSYLTDAPVYGIPYVMGDALVQITTYMY